MPRRAGPGSPLARRALTWMAVGLAGVALWSAGQAAPLPPIEPAQWLSWLGGHSPRAVASSLARVVGLLCLAHITCTALLAWLAARRGHERLARDLVHRSLPGTRALTARLVAFGLTASVTAGQLCAAAPGAGAAGPAEARQEQPVGPVVGPTASVPPVMRALDGPSPGPALTWVIRSGDHLWGVAEHVLTAARTRPPTEAEIADYLDAVVARNRDRLAVPGHPELVFPGQEIELPAVR